MTVNPPVSASSAMHYRVHLNRLPARPKVSVLITNFNYEEFLPRSIKSVLAQFWRPIEIIVSDDGSQDLSCEVVQSYIDRGHPVTLVRGEHRGMAACLSAAFAASSGEIVCLLDADDCFLPGKIEAVISAFRSNRDSGFCIHRTQRVDHLGRMGGAFPLLQKLPSGDCAQLTIRNSGILMGLPPTSALSLRREVADIIFPIPECYVGYAEQMVHRIAPLVTPACAIEKALSTWTLHRRNDANATRVKVERLERELRFMEMLWQDQKQFLQVHNPSLAPQLQPLQYNALYAKMHYVKDRLDGNKNASVSHSALCKIPDIRNSYIGTFWRYSNRLPRPIFRKTIDLLETQGNLKHFLGRFLHRETSVA